jgi:uncharacterized membrane protein (DUF106 family)
MMKQFKEENAQMRKQMKELRGQPEKLAELNKKMMKKQMTVMVHSFKPTLFTIIPIFLIFGWLNAHYSYGAITPETEFSTSMIFLPGTTGEAKIVEQQGITIIGDATKEIKDNKAEWTLKGNAGEYLLEYKFNNKTYTKELLISNKQEYKPVSKKITGNAVKEIRIKNPNLKLLNLFGWKVGWLATYILFSIAFSLLLRKILRVY